MILPLFVGVGALLGAASQLGGYIRILILLELLLTAGSLVILRLNPGNSLELQGAGYLNSLTLLSLTGAEAILGLSLLALAQLSVTSA